MSNSFAITTLSRWGSRALKHPKVSRVVISALTAQSPIKHLTGKLAKPFVAGDSIADAVPLSQSLSQRSLMSTIDLLGEDVSTPDDALNVRNSYIELVERCKNSGAKTNFSVKLSALGQVFDEKRALENLLAISEKAKEMPDSFIRVDMEGSARTESTLKIVEAAKESGANVGTVLQAALHRTGDDLTRLAEQNIRVRLVKGAYSEPQQIAIIEPRLVTAAYLRHAATLLKSNQKPAFATHDPTVLQTIRREAEARGISKDKYEFQMLLGVNPDLPPVLAEHGHLVRIYAPVGPDAIPYLVRRMAERPEHVALVLRALNNMLFGRAE